MCVCVCVQESVCVCPITLWDSVTESAPLVRLSINLTASRSRDIAFHMNPRLREGIVVRNSKMEGNWGPEERELSVNPFMEGQYFDVRLKHCLPCHSSRFSIYHSK